MKVFVSSTCHDLIDLRDELYEELRGVGVDPLFSELAESAFRTSGEPDQHSIGTCLENVRASDVVLVILSQRYGRPLPKVICDEELSATHLEFREAVIHKKRIHFYVRDRLAAEYDLYRKNKDLGNPIALRWADPKHTEQLFAFLAERERIINQDRQPTGNNWYWSFKTSVDLRKRVRQDVEPEAFAARTEELVESGLTPIVLVMTQGVQTFGNTSSGEQTHYRFTFGLVNAGQVAAIGVRVMMQFPNGDIVSSAESVLATVLPYGSPSTQQLASVNIDKPIATIDEIIRNCGGHPNPVECEIQVTYCTPTGAQLADASGIVFRTTEQRLSFATQPQYVGKRIGERRRFLNYPLSLKPTADAKGITAR